MKKIMLFAGTTEGRKLAEFLVDYPAEVYVSVATEYGRSCIRDSERIRVLCGRMDQQEMEDCFERKRIELVIDATHTFAKEVTAHIKNACIKEKIPYIRCLREQTGNLERLEDKVQDTRIIRVESVEDAVAFLKDVTGNILIATGSKELELYTRIECYKERCFARVLSVKESLDKSIRLGFEGRNLIAMQGPFTKEMNVALLRQTNASYFVTKESGNTGGFREKAEAAAECGAVLVVVDRPEEEGWEFEKVCTYLAGMLAERQK